MDKKAQTIRTYNATAAAMAEKFNGLGARIKDIEKGFSYFSIKNPKVLEIGCGNGRDAAEILKRTNDYLGMDISDTMIQIAQVDVPEGDFQVADVEHYAFPKGIDLIFSFASLLHSDKENVEKVLAHAGHALNSGGIFYISLKYGDYHESSKTDEFGTRTYYFYTPELIKELAGSAYRTAFEETQELRGQKWFTIALQKV